MRRTLALSILVSFSLVSLAHAQGDMTDVLPSAFETTEGNSSSAFPFASSGQMRTMYAYEGSELGHAQPVRLRGIAFRPNGGGTTFGPVTYDLTVHLSTGTRPATNLSRTFESNHGADKTRVINGSRSVTMRTLGSTPNDFVLYMSFSSRFTWNPSCGPLIIDIQSRGISAGSNSVSIDGQSGSSSIGRIVHRSNANAATADFPSTGTQNFALIAQLDIETQVGPSSVTSTEGNSSSSYPWNRPVGSGMRVQYIYDGSTFFARGRQRITRLGFRPDNGNAFGGGQYDMQVTLSTGAPNLSASASATFASNTGTDAKVVFDGTFIAPATPGGSAPNGFDLDLKLQDAFEYNPAEGSLVMDLQVRNVVSNGGTSFDGPFNTGVGVARVFNTGSATATTGSIQDFALSLAIAGSPKPTLPEMDDFTVGGSSSSFPWNSSSPMRVQYAYDQNSVQLLQEHQITHLSWRPRGGSTFGPVTYECTIDLSTGTSPGSLTTVFNNNHGSDRVRVFDGRFSVPYTVTGNSPNDFIVQVKLDRPFRWNPFAGALIVDIRFLNIEGGNTTSFDGSFDASLGRIAHRSNPNALTADFGPQGFALDMSIGGIGCNGLLANYGTACAGTQGTPVISANSLPTIPNPNFRYRLVNGPANSPVALSIGFSASFINLAVFGAPGCTLYNTGDITILPTSTNGTGEAFFPTPIPDNPALDGGTFHATWLIFDPGANAANIITSGGMQLTLCH